MNDRGAYDRLKRFNIIAISSRPRLLKLITITVKDYFFIII